MTTAQVFARDSRLPSSEPLVYLERGSANDLRGDVNAGYLVCPIGGCADPRFVVRGGTKRDHFAHKPGVHGHAPESIAHHTGKELIARWLRTHYPDATVNVDDQDIEETGQRPDVLLTLPGGRRIAYEIQLAYQSGETWLARHNKYAAEGIRDVWLFGGRHYLRTRRHSDEDQEVALHPTFETVLSVRHPMLLIDPAEQTVALGVGHWVEEHLAAGGVRPPPHGRWADIERWHPLDEVPAAGGVIDIPGTRALMGNLDAAHKAWLRHLADEDRIAEANAREAERVARLVAAAQELEGSRLAELDRRDAAWAPERARIEAVHGRLPVVVVAPPVAHEADVLGTAPAQWRWQVLVALSEHQGGTVTAPTLVEHVGLLPGQLHTAAWQFLNPYLAALRRMGWVWFWGLYGPNHEPIHVLASVTERPSVEPPAASLMRDGRTSRVSGPPPDGVPARAEGRATPKGGFAGWSPVQRITTRQLADLPGPLQDVYHAHPAAWEWVQTERWWTFAGLPERLHHTAQLAAYLACEVTRQGTIGDLRVARCSDVETAMIASALRHLGYITYDGAVPTTWRALR